MKNSRDLARNLTRMLTVAAVSAAAFAAPLAQAASGNDSVWVRDSQKAVYWIPSYKLKVDLNKVEASNDAWAMVQVSLEPDTEGSKRILVDLQTRYPGYTLTRVVADAHGNAQIASSALGLQLDVAPKMGSNGLPYADYQGVLTRKQVEAFTQLRGQGDLIASIELTARVPTETIVEQAAVDANDVCPRLLKNGRGTLIDVIENYPQLSARIDQATANETFRASMKKKALSACLSFFNQRSVESFADLSDEPLALNRDRPFEFREVRKAFGPVAAQVKPLIEISVTGVGQ